MRKKLQVFISSTYKDLIEERQAAVEAVLSSGHIPAGMELFKAGDESQLETIKRWIDESDVYFLILGGRYGSIEPVSGKSYTHLEYEYALNKGMPVFAVVIQDDALDRKVKEHGRDMEEREHYSEYKSFKSFVLTKICKFFGDNKDIQLAIFQKMSECETRADLAGWISGKEINKDDRLIKERNELEIKIKELEEIIEDLTKNKGNYNGFTYDEVCSIIENYEIYITDGRDIKSNVLDIFLQNKEHFSVGVRIDSLSSSTNVIERVAIILENFGLVYESRRSTVSYTLKTSIEGYRFLATYGKNPQTV